MTQQPLQPQESKVYYDRGHRDGFAKGYNEANAINREEVELLHKNLGATKRKYLDTYNNLIISRNDEEMAANKVFLLTVSNIATAVVAVALLVIF